MYRCMREEHGLVGCIGMMCGGTDVMVFEGTPFASITFGEHKRKEPEKRMQIMAQVFPKFQNIVISRDEYHATNADCPLPDHAIHEIRTTIETWLH